MFAYFVIAAGLAGLGLLVWLVRRYLVRAELHRRLWTDEPDAAAEELAADPLEQRGLTRWLYLAGFRSASAPLNFAMVLALTLGGGIVLAQSLRRSGILAVAERAAANLPGGLGNLAQPILRVAPWLLLAMLIMLPFYFVRAVRRRRVQRVERDLPITLELLATLAESGLGFDSAIGRILDSQDDRRPLASELRTLQAELLAGRSRVECLRRVARRLDVISVTVFISAIVQAEQIGSKIAAVLRQQADDLRQRRRERALEFSMALPVKQLFPLVICFLPGILLFALGPLFAEFLRYMGVYEAAPRSLLP